MPCKHCHPGPGGVPPTERHTKRNLDYLEGQLRQTQRELDRMTDILDLKERLVATKLETPEWIVAPRDPTRHAGIATLQFSDSHFDEVVRPEQVQGYNAYNRRIATRRLEALATKTIEVAYDYMKGVSYAGATVLSTGDIFSGDIHDELKQTNEDTLYGSMVYWAEQMSAFLRTMKEGFSKVHVAAVVGNHGRDSKKPIYKNRPQSNIEWLLWQMLQREFANDDAITFQIAPGLTQLVKVYGTRYQIEHGDEFKGGSGISGARAPLLLGQHRAAVRNLAMGRPLDYLVVGHFHQYQPPSQGLIMGGSLKGYDEYASGKHLRPEPPTQGFWVTTPERGPTVFAPIFVQNRKAEGW